MNNKEVLGLNKITKARLKELCKKNKLYQTPYLNDQLYLHYQGFEAIENLEEYTGLKCLWLESNAISEIQGLECQPELKCLFLQNNLIKKIENLQSCLLLDTLNLASNHITRVENCGVDVLPVLSTLNLSRNYLRNSEALRELVNCRNLWSLDLSHNRIDDILVVKIFANMPELRVLVLQGNPVVSQVPQYRKTLILECKNLTYLDSRPVFPKDRACAEAWKRGGYEEERRENDRWVREDRKKIRDSVNATLRLRQKQGGGDVQLLESTDDEEENSKPTKLKKIPEEIVSEDLEITGVNTASKNKDIKRGIELGTSESSLSDSSDCEGSILKCADGVDEESRAIEIRDTADIQMQPIRDQVIQDTSSSIQMQYLEEQDLVISGDAINISKATNCHDEETKFELDPKSAATNHSISDNGEALTSTDWNESTTLVTSLTSDLTINSDLSSSGFSIYGDFIEIPGNTDNVLEYMPSEECSKEGADIETKSEEDKDSLTEDVVLLNQKLTINISSESQFADSELSPQRPSPSEEEAIQTYEIGTQGEIPLQHTTFSELISPSPTLGTDINFSELEDSSFENTKLVSDMEDSGLFNIFNSADASERILTSDDESGDLPDLESALPNEEQDQSNKSIWQDIILTELRENEANGANEDKYKTTDRLELGTDSSSQSEMITSNKTNTLSSSLFVENSDEEKAMKETLEELDASTWLKQIVENSLEMSSQKDVSKEKTFGEKNSSEMSYQSDGSSLLEYILSNEKESEKSSLEMLTEDATLYDGISQQTSSTRNEEDMSSLEELRQLRHWHEKDAGMALGERVSLQNLLATLEEKEEEKLSSSEFNKRRVQLEQWLGENASEVEDEDEDMSEKQEHVYIQSVEEDDGTLSFMCNTEVGQTKDKTFEEGDMLQSILKQIEEEGDQRFTSNEDLEHIDNWLGEGKDKSLSGISEGSGNQNSFSCSSPYEEVFDNKHFSLMSTLAPNEDCKVSEEESELRGDILTRSILNDRALDEKTVPLTKLDDGLADNMSSNESWWEKTLAAARKSSEPPKVPTDDESFEETIKQTQTLQEQVEASALLEHILTTTRGKEIEISPNQTEAAELPSNETNEEYFIKESKPTTTIRDVLSSFNKVAENIATTRYLNTYAMTIEDFSTQSSDQINRQVEEMNREQRERVSQMIDRVYAQKDKYNDNLDVVDGRLMVVKRSTGELEELPLPPTSPSKYTSCGVSTTPGNCYDSSSDDYGTALSEDEPDDDDDSDIEQHASDTKIKKIPYLSAVYGNESSKSTRMGLDEVEDNCHRENNEHEFDSKHIVMELDNEIDTVVCTEWLKKGAAGPAGRVTTEKANGEEKALLLRKLCGGTTELQTDLSCRCCQQMHVDVDDGAALRDVALMFEPSEGRD